MAQTYKLTLTKGQREAFDWNGYRYASSGDKMSALICEGIPEDAEWSQEGDITFEIPEHVAWEMQELAEEENHSWTSFNGDLTSIMEDFISQIV